MLYTQKEANRVIYENGNLIRSICSKYKDYPDKEDLYQEASIAIIDALKNYDETKNTKFSTYAFPYIVGKVSNYVRENKNIKISKDLIRLGKKINEYMEKHKEVRGYLPSIKDIAIMLNVKEEKIIYAIDAYNFNTKSLDEQINEDGKIITLLDKTPSRQKISKEQMLDLKEAFKYLSKEEKILLVNRYFKDLTQKEVANLFGVNQVYISRLEKKALIKMKSKMI